MRSRTIGRLSPVGDPRPEPLPRPHAGRSARRARHPSSRGRGARRGCARRRAPGRASRPTTTSASSPYSVSAVEQPCPDVRSQRAEAVVLRALPPVVDEHLVHPVQDVELERAHRPVRHEQRAFLEPRGTQDRLGCREPGCLDHDVRAFDGLAHGVDHPDRLVPAPAPASPRTPAGTCSRLLVTRISSKSNRPSSMVTLENAVPRAPTCPSTFESRRARWRPPTAVRPPVRRSVISVPSTIATGTPVRGS